MNRDTNDKKSNESPDDIKTKVLSHSKTRSVTLTKCATGYSKYDKAIQEINEIAVPNRISKKYGIGLDKLLQQVKHFPV